jgi:phage-related protein
MLESPILFENSSEDLSTLGLGVMTGLTDWEVESELSKVPKLTGTWDASNWLTPEIQNGHVIMADASDKRKNQLFFIDKIAKKADSSTSGQIEIEAHGCAGELIKNSIASDISLVNANPQQFWDALMQALTDGVPDFHFHTDIVSVANVNLKWKDVSNLEEVLFGEGSTGANGVDSFRKLYGGEWFFDNYDLYFLKQAGRNGDQVITYGDNLKSISQEESIQDIYTAVQGYATLEKDKEESDPVKDAQEYVGEGLVQYLGAGGLPVYSYPGGAATGQYIQNGQHIQLTHRWTDNDSVEWLQLADGNWINGKHVVVDSKGAWVANSVIGQGHIKWNISSDGQGNIYETVNGVLVADYLFGKVPIFSRPTTDSNQTGYLDTEILRWQVFLKTKDDSNVTWYNLGGDQWVSSQFVQFDKQSAYTYTPARGVGTVNHDTKVENGKNKGQYEGVAVWSEPHYGKPSHVVKYVYHGQRYKIFKEANNNGTTWYNLGGNQWIDSQYMDFAKDDRDVKPKTDEELGNEGVPAPKYSGKVVVYDHPGWQQQPTGDYLYSGDQVTIDCQASVGNGTWYHVQGSGWINGSYVDFGQATDVDPYDPSEDIVIDIPVEEQIVTLPQKYVKAPLADHYEHLKILKQDFSEYHITSEDKLKQVIDAFIYDNRIGEVPVDIDVEYYQMRGKYQFLTTADLGDRAPIFYPKLDINQTGEVTKIVWNGPAGRIKSLHFGKLPETLRDTLDQFLYQADENAAQRVTQEQKRTDQSIEIVWDKFHDEAAESLANVNRSFSGVYEAIDKSKDELAKQTQTISQQQVDQAMKTYQDSVDSEIGTLKTEIASKVTNDTGVLHYGTTAITAQAGNGNKVSIGADGVVFTKADGTVNSVFNNDGEVAAKTFVGNEIAGVDLYSATLHTGEIDSAVQIKSPKIIGTDMYSTAIIHVNGPDNSQNAVMSWENGFTTTNATETARIAPHGFYLDDTSRGQVGLTWNDINLLTCVPNNSLTEPGRVFYQGGHIYARIPGHGDYKLA